MATPTAEQQSANSRPETTTPAKTADQPAQSTWRLRRGGSGRPIGGYAFRHCGRPIDGPLGRLWDVTDADMLDIEEMIRLGSTAHRVVCSQLQIAYRTYWQWMTEGEQEDCVNKQKRAFYLRVFAAITEARGETEQVMRSRYPDLWLTKGPHGRTKKDDPGWTEEQITRLADETGEGPPRYVLEVTSTGFQAHKVGSVPAQIGSGDETDEER